MKFAKVTLVEKELLKEGKLFKQLKKLEWHGIKC